jgi:hypothetical protein
MPDVDLRLRGMVHDRTVCLRPTPSGPPCTTGFTAVVTRVGCSCGVDGEPDAPAIESSEVRITFKISPHIDSGTCEGTPGVPYEVELNEPLGDRSLVDGGSASRGPMPGPPPSAKRRSSGTHPNDRDVATLTSAVTGVPQADSCSDPGRRQRRGHTSRSRSRKRIGLRDAPTPASETSLPSAAIPSEPRVYRIR